MDRYLITKQQRQREVEATSSVYLSLAGILMNIISFCLEGHVQESLFLCLYCVTGLNEDVQEGVNV